MKKNVEKIIAAIVALLAIDLWGVHAKLLYQLNPDKIGDTIQTFSYVALNENTITALLFSLVFAFVPVLVLTTISPKLDHYWFFVIVFALFDGGAWFIYYNKTAITHFSIFGAAYYGLFIVFIVASIGFVRMLIDDLDNKKPDIDIEQIKKQAWEELSNSNKEVDIKSDCSLRKDPTEEINFHPRTIRPIKQFEDRIVKKHSDTKEQNKDPAEQELLFIQYINEGLPGKEIAEKLNWHPSKVSRTKNKLISNGKIRSN